MSCVFLVILFAQRNAWVIFNCADLAYEKSTFRRIIYCLCLGCLHLVSVTGFMYVFVSNCSFILGTFFVTTLNSSWHIKPHINIKSLKYKHSWLSVKPLWHMATGPIYKNGYIHDNRFQCNNGYITRLPGLHITRGPWDTTLTWIFSFEGYIQPKYNRCCMQEKSIFRLPWQLIKSAV